MNELEGIDRGLCEALGSYVPCKCQLNHCDFWELTGSGQNMFKGAWSIIVDGRDYTIHTQYWDGELRVFTNWDLGPGFFEFNCELCEPLLLERLLRWFKRTVKHLKMISEVRAWETGRVVSE